MVNKPVVGTLTVGLAAFAAILLLPVVLFALYFRVVPNIFEAPIQQLWQLFGSLLSSNAGAALRLLFSQPLAIAGYVETSTGLRVWEVYAYPIPTLVLLTSALFGGAIAARGGFTRPAQVQLAAGLACVVLGLNHVRMAACCTGPGWVVDVWLRGLALTPSPGSAIDWPVWYQRIEPLFLPVQLVLVAGGVVLMVLAGRSKAEQG